MDVLGKIIKIEKEQDLFAYKNAQSQPLWDILRYDVLKAIDARVNPQSKTLVRSKKKLFSKLISKISRDFISCFRLLFIKRRPILVHSSPRNQNSEGYFFDKIAYDLIKTLGDRCVVTETGFATPMLYKTHPLPETLYTIVYSKICKKHVSKEYAQNLVTLFNDKFGKEVLTVNDLDDAYTKFSALSS